MNSVSLKIKALFSKYKLFFLYGGLIIVLIPLIIFILSSRKPQIPGNINKIVSPSPILTITSIPSPSSVPPFIQQPKISILQKTEIGKTISLEIDKYPNIEKKESLSNGDTKYSLTSHLIPRPNIILTNKQGVAEFESILIPSDPNTAGYVKISELLQRYGQPEKTIAGSRFYDWIAKTFIYPSKGIAFIGNPNTDEVFEIHAFQPTTLGSYIEQYGSDLDPNATPPVENPNPNQ